MKKVLIITYYWPPSGGSGVQRWLKMSKYLPRFGWEPVIYTPENPEAGMVDQSLLKDVSPHMKVLKKKITEPFELYKKLTGRKKGEMIGTGFLSEKETPSLAEKLSVWIRGNFFIPDARMWWIKPSVRFLTGYLKSHPVDLIVSTGPPHSMHLIALALHEKMNTPWVADFRDPWTGIDFYHQLMLTKAADRKHHTLEKKVLSQANGVLTVNWNLAEDLKKIANRNVDVITNGYDEEDYDFLARVKPDQQFSICHLGSMNKDRNHEIFWQALSELRDKNPQLKHFLKVILIGATDISARKMIQKYRLDDHVQIIKFMEHRQALQTAAKAQLLYLPLNNTPNAPGITPTKLFEYLALQRPIVGIGPEKGDAARIIHDTGSGVVTDFTNKQGLVSVLKDYFQQFIRDGHVALKAKNNEKYSRKVLAKNTAHLFNRIS